MFVFQVTLRPSEHQKWVWSAFPVSGSGGTARSPVGAGPVLPRLGLPEQPGCRTPGLCPSKPPASPWSPWPSRPCRLSRHPEVVVALVREAALSLLLCGARVWSCTEALGSEDPGGWAQAGRRSAQSPRLMDVCRHMQIMGWLGAFPFKTQHVKTSPRCRVFRISSCLLLG